MQGIWRNAAVAVALALAIAFGADRLSHSNRIENIAPQTSALPSNSVAWSRGHDGSLRNAEEHWEKHGREFPEFHSAQEYEQGALRFVTDPPPGTLIKTNDRGDTLYYDPASNTFAVKNRHGEPRTYFRPDHGRAYWDRQ